MNINELFSQERMAKFVEYENEAREEKLKAIQIDCIKSVINDLYDLVTKHKDCDPVTRSMAMSMASDYLLAVSEMEGE